MAISRIIAQDATGTGTTSATATYGSTPTQGNLLVAIAYAQSSSGTLIPPSGWTYAIDSGQVSGGIYLYYKIASASDATIITFSSSDAASMQLSIYEYEGNSIISVLDGIAAGSATSLTCPTGTTSTTVQADEMAIAAAHWNVNQTLSSWSNSFTNITTVASRLFVSELLLSAIGTQSSALTVTGSLAGGVGIIATFKAKNTSPGTMTNISSMTNVSTITF